MNIVSTLEWFSEPNEQYLDYMAIGYPTTVMPDYSTVELKTEVIYDIPGDTTKRQYDSNITYSEALSDGVIFDDTNGLIWSVYPYISYSNYGVYPLETAVKTHVYDENNVAVSDVHIQSFKFIMSVQMVPYDTNNVYSDNNMIIWTDYRHMEFHITFGASGTVRVYLIGSNPQAFLTIDISFQLRDDMERLIKIQLIFDN